MAPADRRDMPSRLLRLLVLLQSRSTWTGDDLAERLGVSERTLRRDMQRLRELDYPVDGVTGVAGGYSLNAGRNMPPLMLDGEEVITLAASLTASSASMTRPMSEAALRVLAKLAQIMPRNLQEVWNAITGKTAVVHEASIVQVSPRILGVLARSCSDSQVLTFKYYRRDGALCDRRVEPHNVVLFGGYWYLLAFDNMRDDWRVFRVDRIQEATLSGRYFVPRDVPGNSAVKYVSERFAQVEYSHIARLTVGLSADQVRERWNGPQLGRVERQGSDRCLVVLSALDSTLVVQQAAAVAALGGDIEIEASAEVQQGLRRLGAALQD